MSKQQMVLFAIGPDKPGLVKDISAVIYQAGANLEDSRMAVLAGDFALIVLFSGDDAAVAKVSEQCTELERKLRFKTYIKPASHQTMDVDLPHHSLQVVGVDQPGIVHLVSTILADLEINIVSLESRLAHAAFAGTELFKLRAEIATGNQSVIDNLKTRLEETCGSLDLDFDLDPL